jgi:hypothetical protein
MAFCSVSVKAGAGLGLSGCTCGGGGAVEAAAEVLDAGSRANERRVPAEGMESLVRRWKFPDLTEAHTLTVVESPRS